MLKSKKRSRTIIITAISIIICISAVVLFSANKGDEALNKNREPINGSTKLEVFSDDMKVVNISGSIVEYTVPELFERSSMVVYGKVSEISDAFAINWVGGGSSLATDVTIIPTQILRGDEKDSITVRVMGGLVGDVYEDYAEVPEMTLDEELLLFLYQPNAGGGMNTEGDYYYTVGLYQGVFEAVNENEAKELQGKSRRNDDVIFVNSFSFDASGALESSMLKQVDGLGDMTRTSAPITSYFTLSSLSDAMSGINRMYPVDFDIEKDERMAAYEMNLQNGIITQEEYIDMVGNLSKYAAIVDPNMPEPTPNKEAEAEREAMREALKTPMG